jgi:hypothetical protein
MDLLTQFDAQWPIDRSSIAAGLGRDKCFNIGEVFDPELADVIFAYVAAVGVDRVNLYPKTVIPVGTAGLS